MLITYSADGKPATTPHGHILAALIIVDAAFALTVIFGWTFVSFFISEPVHWATWQAVGPGSTFLELFSYPFAMLWLMPATGILGAWAAHKSKRFSVAYTFALLPIVFLGLIFGWYYFTPADWR